MITLFHPHVPEAAIARVAETLRGRWIGQGPQVDLFEARFKDMFSPDHYPVAVGACTDALHLAYVLAGVGPGDEVLAPVFTCTATNIPLLYQRVTIRFIDVDPETLNVDPSHVARLVSERTKLLVCVPYGGMPCDMAALRSAAPGIPIVQDAAHALGATYRGAPIATIAEYTAFSFQAVKQLTTCDGGMLVVADSMQAEVAKRLRWFGIDRPAKQAGTWANDIVEVGYKYQMTDVSAAIGLEGLETFADVLALRRDFLHAYEEGLSGIGGLRLIARDGPDSTHAAWLCTVLVENRENLMRKLQQHGIESAQVHYRNDRYSIFRAFCGDELPGMDAIESRYLVLPLHTRMSLADVGRICTVIRSGW